MTNVYTRFLLPIAAAAGLVSAVSADESSALAGPEAFALASWQQSIAQSAPSEEGCFEAAFPEFVWKRSECSQIAPGAIHPVRRQPDASAGGGDVTGNGHDYAAKAAGLITRTVGTFPVVTGVTSEKSVGVAAFGGGGILGPNEYSLQVNTNYTGTTSVCAGHSGCTVWQQFIYAPDYARKGQGAVFIQYWLIGWGSTSCPSTFGSDGGGDCYKNSAIKAAPDMPITSLSKLSITATATAGGNDTVVFNNGTTAYTVTAKDSVLDISAVWNESEWNIVGNAGGSRAKFNSGSSVTVKAALTDGSTAAPGCIANAGSTGETNNLNLGPCTVAGGASPSIQFTESN